MSCCVDFKARNNNLAELKTGEPRANTVQIMVRSSSTSGVSLEDPLSMSSNPGV